MNIVPRHCHVEFQLTTITGQKTNTPCRPAQKPPHITTTTQHNDDDDDDDDNIDTN